jgi:hypothetical protein
MDDPQDTPSGSQQYANELIGLANAEKRVRSERPAARPGLTRERAVLIGLTVAVPILVAILLVTFAGSFVDSWFETRPPVAVARAEAQKILDTLVGEIEAFRKDYNELPQTLVEVGVPPRGKWDYAASGTAYRVRGSLYGQAVSFDSITKAGIR